MESDNLRMKEGRSKVQCECSSAKSSDIDESSDSTFDKSDLSSSNSSSSGSSEKN